MNAYHVIKIRVDPSGLSGIVDIFAGGDRHDSGLLLAVRLLSCLLGELGKGATCREQIVHLEQVWQVQLGGAQLLRRRGRQRQELGGGCQGGNKAGLRDDRRRGEAQQQLVRLQQLRVFA